MREESGGDTLLPFRDALIQGPSPKGLLHGPCFLCTQHNQFPMTAAYKEKTKTKTKTHVAVFLATSIFLACFTDSLTASAYAAGYSALGPGR